MNIQIIRLEDFLELSEKQDVFADIADIDTGEEITFLVKYFFIKDENTYYKTTKLSIPGDSKIEEVVLMHSEDEFRLAGKEKEEKGYKKFAEDFSREVYDMIVSYLPNREVFIAENRG